MKLCLLADLHGDLPEIPDCDLLLLGGDYSPRPASERQWLEFSFRPWLQALKDRGIPVVGVAGNHDFAFAKREKPDLPWTYLQDSGCQVGALKIWGSPWQKRFFNWAFNADEDFMKERWELIPKDTDILLLHGPPHGCGDRCGKENTGSPSLWDKILEIQPGLVVCGHIHHGRGEYWIGNTKVINTARGITEVEVDVDDDAGSDDLPLPNEQPGVSYTGRGDDTVREGSLFLSYEPDWDDAGVSIDPGDETPGGDDNLQI